MSVTPSASLIDLGWPADLAPPIPSHLRPARVVQQERGGWQVHDGAAVHLVRSARGDVAPVTGDWVLLSAAARIEQVLPRRTTLSRAEAGGRSAEQVIAANVDVVAICAPVDGANLNRIERELTAVWSSGARPLLVLTKSDRTEDPGSTVRQFASACVGVGVLAVSSLTGEGLEDLRRQVPRGVTVVLIGPSGVGKSSLVNALLGREELATSPTRSDDKGRHTTTTRSLVLLPGAGLLLDTPGMREFAPWTGEEGLAGTFADLEELAEHCRFADCAHRTEPGCAVLAAADADPEVAERLERWRRLQRELAWLERRHDARLMAEERRAWARMTRSARGQIRP